jgi:hypothetical protein
MESVNVIFVGVFVVVWAWLVFKNRHEQLEDGGFDVTSSVYLLGGPWHCLVAGAAVTLSSCIACSCCWVGQRAVRRYFVFFAAALGFGVMQAAGDAWLLSMIYTVDRCVDNGGPACIEAITPDGTACVFAEGGGICGFPAGLRMGLAPTYGAGQCRARDRYFL